jgi:hypothetical protein
MSNTKEPSVITRFRDPIYFPTRGDADEVVRETDALREQLAAEKQRADELLADLKEERAASDDAVKFIKQERDAAIADAERKQVAYEKAVELAGEYKKERDELATKLAWLEPAWSKACDQVQAIVQRDKLGFGGENIFELLGRAYNALKEKLTHALEVVDYNANQANATNAQFVELREKLAASEAEVERLRNRPATLKKAYASIDALRVKLAEARGVATFNGVPYDEWRRRAEKAEAELAEYKRVADLPRQNAVLRAEAAEDALSAVAAVYGTTLEEIASANNLTVADYVKSSREALATQRDDALAMLGLQSVRYSSDADYRDAVDAILASTAPAPYTGSEQQKRDQESLASATERLDKSEELRERMAEKYAPAKDEAKCVCEGADCDHSDSDVCACGCKVPWTPEQDEAKPNDPYGELCPRCDRLGCIVCPVDEAKQEPDEEIPPIKASGLDELRKRTNAVLDKQEPALGKTWVEIQQELAERVTVTVTNEGTGEPAPKACETCAHECHRQSISDERYVQCPPCDRCPDCKGTGRAKESTESESQAPCCRAEDTSRATEPVSAGSSPSNSTESEQAGSVNLPPSPSDTGEAGNSPSSYEIGPDYAHAKAEMQKLLREEDEAMRQADTVPISRERLKQLRASHRWLTHLACGVGKSGRQPDDSEWRAAVEEAKAIEAAESEAK